MPSRRTIRKPTLWTPEEWSRIEKAARERGVPPLRYVREAALAAKLPPRVRRRGSHELLEQLRRVLNNLRQLLCLAEDDGAATAAAAIEATIRLTDEAGAAATGRPGSAEPLIVAIRDAGQFLNELTHQANAARELPADQALGEALARIEAAVRQVPL